jgi:thiosulfate dehydrogenase [quinone] large subunit
MTGTQKWLLILLRLALGGLFFYSGLTKVLDPAWSAGGYLAGAHHLTAFYDWLANPAILPIVNHLNSWGQLLLGASLLLGFWVRLSSALGALLMILYYLPLNFPQPDAHSYIVDQHLIYALALLILGAWQAGRFWGWDARRFRGY